MAESIEFAVGRPPARNTKPDQEVVQNLLNRIARSAGGAEGALRELPQDRRMSTSLQAAIETFQRQNISAANRDGIVNPNGETMQKLNQLTSRPVQIPWQPGGFTAPAEDYDVPGVPLYGQLIMNPPLPPAAAENACWRAAIKMVLDTNGITPVTAPPELVNSRTALDKIAILATYPRYRMYSAGSGSGSLTARQLIDELKNKGPLVAIGRFAAADSGSFNWDGHSEHAVVVKGVTNQGRLVKCNDPWRPSERLLLLDDFNSKLTAGVDRLLACSKHIRNWQTVPQATTVR